MIKSIKRILLVDDDGTCLFLTGRLLGNLLPGAEVRTAPNGAVALGLLREGAEAGRQPQLVICDIDMPLMDGLTFMREAERLELLDFGSTRLVLNSSSHMFRNMDRAKVNPAVIFVPKPLTKEKLLGVIG
ncbi:response regulator [Pontibacter russatus]|uniref:response regulator n=1 Tax=Pontibacter russatus TaxID=2694929 RepID=UPI001379B68E|nr:response regulator [Pontibacter russatus]